MIFMWCYYLVSIKVLFDAPHSMFLSKLTFFNIFVLFFNKFASYENPSNFGPGDCWVFIQNLRVVWGRIGSYKRPLGCMAMAMGLGSYVKNARIPPFTIQPYTTLDLGNSQSFPYPNFLCCRFITCFHFLGWWILFCV